MQVVLVMFRNNGHRRSFSITREVTVIGRREDCDFRIPLGEVSRKHCRLVRDGQQFRVEDLGSSNGTYVNGKRIQEASLNPGDTFQIGPLAFVLQVDGQPEDEEVNPVWANAKPIAGQGDESSEGDFDPTTLLMENPEDSGAMTVQTDDDIVPDLEEADRRTDR